MCIYFTPTYLYIKQHNVTGLKYFGKTTRKDPYKYKGSGLYWTRHLKLHGNDFSTVWVKLFNNKEELMQFAMRFSIDNDIVKSKEWANVILENGLDGNHKGIVLGPMTDQHKQKISNKLTGKVISEETKKLMSEKAKGNTRHKGKPHTAEAKLKMSAALTGKKHSEETKQKMRLAHLRRKLIC